MCWKEKSNKPINNNTENFPGQRKYAWARSITVDNPPASTPSLPLSPRPLLWEEPIAEQLQSRSAFQLARAKRSKTISSHVLEQWQSSWEAYRLTKTTPIAALTTPLSKKRLRIHEGLAKAESSLATQIRTEKIGLADFTHRRRVPVATSPACPCGWHRQTAKHIIMFCPLYDFGSRGPIGAPANYTQLVNTARDLKNITSRLIKTGIFARFSVGQEQLYG